MISLQQITTYQDAVRRADLAGKLGGLDWCVAGTPPLGLALEGSDIDILCHVRDYDEFAGLIWRGFSNFEGFSIRQWAKAPHAVVATFHCAGWPFEIFGEKRPLRAQAGWRHYEVERRLLALGGVALHAKVMAARRGGLKTEPAFAAVLGLAGDPYAAVLDLFDADDTTLAALIAAG
ncbi:DUF4269 domain-containing protein [Metarhizobium album]|uniref:DUF4269 domain-containing protein n=1 Tax=Metarhizobium album TaxID=2182425 RepID=A0A2U2DKQ0_9HYPH|nr:DUF4269 domain-containing protein [Rhizobium album]